MTAPAKKRPSRRKSTVPPFAIAGSGIIHDDRQMDLEAALAALRVALEGVLGAAQRVKAKPRRTRRAGP